MLARTSGPQVLTARGEFRYLLDKLFLCAVIFYAANTFYFREVYGSQWPILRNYFNDLLLIPAALPLVLYFSRLLGLRLHDEPPSVAEITFHLIIWSLILELIGPRNFSSAIGDSRDLLAYFLGAVASLCYWSTLANISGANILGANISGANILGKNAIIRCTQRLA